MIVKEEEEAQAKAVREKEVTIRERNRRKTDQGTNKRRKRKSIRSVEIHLQIQGHDWVELIWDNGIYKWMGDFVSQRVRNGIIVFKFCIQETFFF